MINLIWLFAIPLIASLAVILIPFGERLSRKIAFILSLIPLGLLIYSYHSWINQEIDYAWIPFLGIHFHLKIDGISLLFLFLTSVIIPFAIIAVPKHTHHPHLFYGLILVLQALLIGFFTARDLALFTVFWEAMLLPLYFIIAYWGREDRQNASLKFLIYMIAGSSLLVAAVLALYFASGNQGKATFDMQALAQVVPSLSYAPWIFAIFLLAFAVKTPLFPFHAWLPDSYFQAPLAGTILLSALLSKAGIYGIIRIGWSMFPQQMQEWGHLLLILAIIGVFYAGLAAWRQADYKRLIAYSSLSHVNFVLAGLFIWNETAHTGAIFQAINHGITIAALFLVAGWLEKRINTTSMEKTGGLAVYFPYLCWLTLIFVLSSVALPSTNNFIGELLIFFGLFKLNPWLTATLGLSIILSVIYMLSFMKRIYFGPLSFPKKEIQDLHPKEFLIAIPLIALIFWMGLYPTPFLEQISEKQETQVIAKAEASDA